MLDGLCEDTINGLHPEEIKEYEEIAMVSNHRSSKVNSFQPGQGLSINIKYLWENPLNKFSALKLDVLSYFFQVNSEYL
jgi:hypothetical protein